MIPKRTPLQSITTAVRNLFRFLKVSDSSGFTGVPLTAKTEERESVEVISPFGFAARPKASDGNGDPMLVTAGRGADAVGLAVVDYRFQPTDLSEGQSRMYDAFGHKITGKSAGWEVSGNVDADGFVDADSGFKKGGSAGKNGTLTITDSTSGATVALTISGGIITGVNAAPPTQWVGD